jgi:hypothetical protein
MKVYRISGYGYTSNILACDRQNARTKFINELNNAYKPSVLLTEANTSVVNETVVDSSYLLR